jgi:hypothetical protein
MIGFPLGCPPHSPPRRLLYGDRLMGDRTRPSCVSLI